LLILRAAQYATGLKSSRLSYLIRRPTAPYRAVVTGLDAKYWEHFDAAYPEFEKIFAQRDVLTAELRLALMRRHVAVIAFPGTFNRRLASAMEGLNRVRFEGSAAAVPVIERDGELAYGFSLDSAGQWANSRHPTEFSLILENFDLEGRPAFCEDARVLAERMKLPPAQSERCLVIANSRAPRTREGDAGSLDAKSETSLGKQIINFDDHVDVDWWEPEVQFALQAALSECETVMVHDSPLGLIALLAGRQVIVTGHPVWAGFGLTEDRSFIRRVRPLTRGEMAGIVMLILSRYVDETGNLVDPLDGWTLPGRDK
jgi:hypothetical protein